MESVIHCIVAITKLEALGRIEILKSYKYVVWLSASRFVSLALYNNILAAYVRCIRIFAGNGLANYNISYCFAYLERVHALTSSFGLPFIAICHDLW